MGKEYKYMINEGVAFSEDKMMKKLSDRAKEGWLLERATIMSFKLKKGEPQNLIYSMDCNNPKDSDKEYFELFEKSGWTHVCSLEEMHFFTAKEGTVPIYTEKDIEIEKYEDIRKFCMIALPPSVLVLVASIMTAAHYGKVLDNTIWFYVVVVVALLSVMIAVPSFMVAVALYLRARKAKK